jgi:hypothetical protein
MAAFPNLTYYSIPSALKIEARILSSACSIMDRSADP